jgi:hypothetical protein
MLFLDGSPHRWFGPTRPVSTLILATDDATGKPLWAIQGTGNSGDIIRNYQSCCPCSDLCFHGPLGPGFCGRRLLPTVCSARVMNSSEPKGRPVRLCRRRARGPEGLSPWARNSSQSHARSSIGCTLCRRAPRWVT